MLGVWEQPVPVRRLSFHYKNRLAFRSRERGLRKAPARLQPVGRHHGHYGATGMQVAVEFVFPASSRCEAPVRIEIQEVAVNAFGLQPMR